MKLEKFLEFFGKEMSYLKFKTIMKLYFHLYLTFLSRQLDNDDGNDNENDIDIFSRTDKHRTYKIPQRTQFVHHEFDPNCKLQFLINTQLQYFYFLFQLQ